MLLHKFTTPDAIADFFRNAGITGIPRAQSSCPIARYAARVYPWAARVRVEQTRIELVYPYRSRRWDPFTRTEMPDAYEALPVTSAMRNFMSRFDRYGYPDLIDGARTSGDA